MSGARRLPLLVMVGPTAVGKTGLSVQVAKRLDAEIISGDSMQVYRGMDIGTAKITPAEMQGIPHHLIDVRAPDEAFSVAAFRDEVDRHVAAIVRRGRLPMLVGGTGLYVRAVLEEYIFAEQDTDWALRERLAEEEQRYGPGFLHGRLQEVDPTAAAKLHPNDLRRIIRALEVSKVSGMPISSTQVAGDRPRRYDDLLIGLTMDRDRLYGRIDQRVDVTLASGWLDEVRGLLRRYSPNLGPMQAIGYRELVLYLRGHLTWLEAVALIRRNTRRFAKRQFTWFRRDRSVEWIDLSGLPSPETTVADIVRMAEGKWPKGVEPEP